MKVAKTTGCRPTGAGDALAAGQAATDDLVGVALVDPGAVRARRFAAVAARLVERPVGQLVGVLLAQDSAGVAVDRGDGAGEADRADAAAGGAGVLQPAGELRRGGAVQDLGVTTGGKAGAVGGEDGCLLLRGWQGRETKHHQPWTCIRWWCSSSLLAPPRGRLTPEGGTVAVPLPADGSCPFVLVFLALRPARVGSLGCRHPAGCRRLPPPVEVSESGPSWTAGKTVLGRSADSEDRHGGRRDREPAGRGPHQRHKTAQHLRGRVQRSGRKAALACSTSARVAPGADTSTCCETAVEPNRFGVAYRAMRLTTDRWAGPVYSVRLKRRCPSVG